MKQKKFVNAISLAVTCMVLAIVAGCGGGGGTSGPDVSAPKIENAKADTSALTFEGGSVILTADVTDDSSISSVIVAVSKDGTLIKNGQQTMTHVGGNTYRTTVTAPANTTSKPVACTVVVYASDASNNMSHIQYTFSVPVAGDAPPVNPF